MKKIYRFKNGKKWSEDGKCTPQKLAISSRHIYPYWYDAIKKVFDYEKERFGRHTQMLFR